MLFYLCVFMEYFGQFAVSTNKWTKKANKSIVLFDTLKYKEIPYVIVLSI